MANYAAGKSVVDGIEIVRLSDAEHKAEVSIAVSVGNMAYNFQVSGRNYLYFPFDSPAALQKAPALCGIPLLGPWANRLDADTYWVNNRKHQLKPELGNIRRDGNKLPIHGLLNFSPKWNVLNLSGDNDSAHVTSQLDFAKYPELMAQFPFAHTVAVTYRLRGGVLSVETTLQNRSNEALPVAIGFHPYFQLPGVPRDQWKLHLSVSQHLKLNELFIPTGAAMAVAPIDTELRGQKFDDVYVGLLRDADGQSRQWVEGGGRRLTVAFGPKYSTAVAYSPVDKDFICFEPMAAITNAFNLAHAGIYHDLQSIPVGGTWSESFSVSIT